MKLTTLLFLSISAVLNSCNGQASTQSDNKVKMNVVIAKGDTVKVLSSNIMVVYQDKKNVYWFGSWETGVYRYDGKTMINYTTKNGLPHNRIEEIKEDNFGNIYFNTSGGISKFDGTSFAQLNVSNNSNNEWKLEPVDLWFRHGWDSGFVYRYDSKFLHRLTLPRTKLGDEFLAANPNIPSDLNTVYCIYEDTKGNVWFGTSAMGVIRYNGKSFDWISEVDVTELHYGPANGVRSIIEDKDGYFWFNTMYRYNVYDNDSLSKSNSQEQVFYSREKGIGSLDGKKDGDWYEYMSIAKDNNNELWMAHYIGGVSHYDGKRISHYSVKDGSKEITLFSIYKDNNGDLWLGTHENGAFKFNGQTFEKFKL